MLDVKSLKKLAKSALKNANDCSKKLKLNQFNVSVLGDPDFKKNIENVKIV